MLATHLIDSSRDAKAFLVPKAFFIRLKQVSLIFDIMSSMKNILQKILKLLAKRTIARYQPTVIGVTGSVGKTTAKEAIYHLLSRRFSVRKNSENFNNEFGVPMTILGIKPRKTGAPKDSYLIWRLNQVKLVFSLLKSAWLAFGWPKGKYPVKFLILELASAKPGDISYLTEMVQPTIGVVTAVGQVPVHVEYYSGPKAVAKEKGMLVESLPQSGLAILNHDDQTVLDMKERSKAKVVTFGFSGDAQIWASDISYAVSDDEKTLGGLSFKVHLGESFVPFRIANIIGIHQIYSVLVAIAVGSQLGLNLVEMADIMESFESPKDRMSLMHGVKNTIVIDDVYNASPPSTHAALDSLRDFGNSVIRLRGTGRRIAVLADMKELGKYSIEAHQGIGALVAGRADILVTVGEHAKFIAEAASSSLSADKIFSFNDSAEAAPKVLGLIQEGDIVLVKGSRSMQMERVLEEIVSK